METENGRFSCVFHKKVAAESPASASRISSPHDIRWFPLLWNLVTFGAVGHYIGHDGITETALVLIHEDGLAAVVHEIVLQVATEVRGREVNLDALLRVLPLNELQRWHEVAVGTDEDDGVGGVEHAVGNHADGDVHVGLLLLGARDGVVTIWTLNLLVEIFATHYLEAVAVDKFVGVEESTLAAALLGVEGRGREIDDFLHLLPLAKESLAELHHVNPVVVAPLRLVALGASQAVVEVESVDVERYALCHSRDVVKIKKPSSDGHVHSRKNGGA